MRRGWVVVLLLVLAGVGAWVVLGGGDGTGEQRGGGATSEEAVGEGPALEGVARKGDAEAQARALAEARGQRPPDAGAWRAYGTVSHADGAPAPDAQVQVSLEGGGTRRLVGSTQARKDGSYVVDLRGLAAEPKERLEAATLRVEAWLAGGGLSNEDFGLQAHLEALAREGLWNRLTLGSGVALRGRVVAQDGKPVPAAQLHVKGSRFRVADLPRAGPDGRFMLVRPEGEEPTLCAFDPAVGAGSQDLRSASADGVLPDLVLHALPAVAGHVRHLDGSPVADARVHVEGEGSAEGCARPWQRVAVSTGEDGSFRVVLPVEGPCEVSVPGAVPVRASTGDENLVLEVRLARVRMRVRTPDGLALEEYPLEVRQWGPRDARALEDLVTHRIDAEAAWGDAESEFLSTDAQGRVDTYVPHGGGLVVAGSEGGRFVEHALRLPTGLNEVELELVARVPESRSVLWVTWQAPDGRPVARARATLRTALGNDLARALGPAPLKLAGVPTGRHVLALVRDASEDWAGTDLHHWILDERVPVVVEAEGDPARTVPARYGGGLHIVLEAEADGARSIPIDEAAFVARAVSPEEPYGIPLRLGWVGGHITRGKAQSRVFAPGRWRVQVARARTHWEPILAESDVEIRPREVTEVRLVVPR